MRLFGRRPRATRASEPCAPEPGRPEPAVAAEAPQLQPPLPEGSYVTDGASLYRVAHAMRDPASGELLVELEDCRTLELILCTAEALAELRLAQVNPALAR